ncbi:2-oxo-hept-3-ene-1,7-dioate hydratase [Prauserella aidingensis]|uniref:2-keto-4-pentenoate hydratase n=1 Tax=Prauserella aidingensis TaxID=387890 RepID=UPI0020A35421|nr:fumarylacetoacetate hydrolase family protein [Prauserella aidingensis]MCP2256262.1 2-oxo-hept-3-ene-1,7-dioate hydratase [Prauserella aidingensis]
MLTPQQISDEAALLITAQRDRVAAPLLSKRLPNVDVDDAYRVASEVAKERLRAGDRIAGYKIGLTSRAAQEMAGIHEPDFGVVLKSKVYRSEVTIPRHEVFQPAVEPELAFRLGKRLQGPGVEVADILAATDEILPCLEVVDSRYESGAVLVDSIADNASAHAIVLADQGVSPASLDLREVAAEVRVNGRVEQRGTSEAVMGNPATAIAWLVNKLSEFDVTLEAGQVVLSGSMTRFVYLDTGAETVQGGEATVAVADFGYLGTVAMSFLGGQTEQ